MASSLYQAAVDRAVADMDVRAWPGPGTGPPGTGPVPGSAARTGRRSWPVTGLGQAALTGGAATGAGGTRGSPGRWLSSGEEIM